jgi:hypothetical protein
MGTSIRLGTRILPKLAWARESALCWFLILSTFVLITAAYRVGIARGLDGYVAPQGAGNFLHAVCAVATKWLTGIGDYVCLEDIRRTGAGIMHDLGLTEDGRSWAYLLDREFLDRALKSLFDHPHWTVRATTSGPPYSGIQGIGWGMDEGHYNFVNLAFRIFGPAIESFYRAYWLLYVASSVFFVLAYRRNVTPLVLLAVAAMVQYMIFSTDTLWFTDGTHPTTSPSNPRFLCSLCVIPALHFLCAAWIKERLGWLDVLLLGLQGFILSVALLQRMTVLWVVLAAVLLATLVWMFCRRSPKYRTQGKRHIAIVGALLGIVVLTNGYTKAVSHPGSAANGYTAGHTLWWPLFYNLQTHPDWKTRYAPDYGNRTGDDLVGFAARQYLANHREEWPPDAFERQETIEYLCRRLFFDFIARDPYFALEVWTRVHFRAVEYYTSNFVHSFLGWGRTGFLAVLVGLGFVFGLAASMRNIRELVAFVPLAAFLSLISLAPNWAIVLINTSLTDYYVLLAIFLSVTFVAFGVGGGIVTRMAGRAILAGYSRASASVAPDGILSSSSRSEDDRNKALGCVAEYRDSLAPQLRESTDRLIGDKGVLPLENTSSKRPTAA